MRDILRDALKVTEEVRWVEGTEIASLFKKVGLDADIAASARWSAITSATFD